MTETDKRSFGLALAELVAAYQSAKELDEVTLNGYWLALADLELAPIKAAIMAASRTNKFMPTAAAIRELVMEQMEDEERRQKATSRRSEFLMSTAISVARDALRDGKSEDWLEIELKRVGRNMNAKLPWPQAYLDANKKE